VPEEDQDVPAATISLKAWPNPFNPTVQLSFEMVQDASVQLIIFDNRGRHVTTLVDGTLSTGVHTRAWDGWDRFGTKMSSGVYFARLRIGDRTVTQKLVMTK
jgi:flagellar hook assembly protein FlgD